jgi:HK97 family phage prohead protease
MKTKTMPASYAPEAQDSAGFEAIVSVFNNKDYGGDIVRPGAFLDSIAYWKNSGDPIPVLWSHRMDDPNYNIGSIVDIDELAAGDKRIPEWASPHVKDNGGLWVKAELDADGIAGQVRHLLMKRRVKQFSFSYDVIEERAGKDGSNELLKLWLHEAGPTPMGMNPLTVLAGAKAVEPDPPPDDEDPAKPDAKFRLSTELFLCRFNAAALERVTPLI